MPLLSDGRPYLEVDAFTQAVRRYENALLAFPEFGDLLLSLVVADVTRHGLDMQSCKSAAQ